MNTQYAAVLYRDNYRCVSCGATDNLTIDHIEQMFWNKTGHKLGRYRQANLRTLCVKCHKQRNKTETLYESEPIPLDVSRYREFNRVRGWSADRSRVKVSQLAPGSSPYWFIYSDLRMFWDLQNKLGYSNDVGRKSSDFFSGFE